MRRTKVAREVLLDLFSNYSLSDEDREYIDFLHGKATLTLKQAVEAIELAIHYERQL